MTDPPPPTGPPPGWYPDPTSGQGFRWWDGAAWTEQTIESVGQPATDSGLGSVNEWINEVLRLARTRAGNFLPMIVVLIVPAGLLNGLMVWWGLQDVVVLTDAETDQISVEGLGDNAIALVGGLVTFLASLVAGAVVAVATVRQTWTLLDDDPEPWSESMRAALGRLPRTLIVTAALLGVIVATYFVVAIGATVAPLSLLLTVPLGVAAVVWVVIRWSLAFVAVAKAPAGVRPLPTSWRLTGGRFWGLLGRTLLVGFIGVTFWLMASLISTPFTALAGGSGGTSTIEPGAEEIRLDEVLPDNPATFAIGQLFSSLANGASVVVWAIGMALLYRRLSGPVEAIEPVPSSGPDGGGTAAGTGPAGR